MRFFISMFGVVLLAAVLLAGGRVHAASAFELERKISRLQNHIAKIQDKSDEKSKETVRRAKRRIVRYQRELALLKPDKVLVIEPVFDTDDLQEPASRAFQQKMDRYPPFNEDKLIREFEKDNPYQAPSMFSESKLDDIKKEADEKFPIYQVGQTVTVHNRRGAVSGTYRGLYQNNQKIKVGNRFILLLDLPKDERIRFDGAAAKANRERYVKEGFLDPKEKYIREYRAKREKFLLQAKAEYYKKKQIDLNAALKAIRDSYTPLRENILVEVVAVEDEGLREDVSRRINEMYNAALPLTKSQRETVDEIILQLAENDKRYDILDGYIVTRKEKAKIMKMRRAEEDARADLEDEIARTERLLQEQKEREAKRRKLINFLTESFGKIGQAILDPEAEAKVPIVKVLTELRIILPLSQFVDGGTHSIKIGDPAAIPVDNGIVKSVDLKSMTMELHNTTGSVVKPNFQVMAFNGDGVVLLQHREKWFMDKLDPDASRQRKLKAELKYPDEMIFSKWALLSSDDKAKYLKVVSDDNYGSWITCLRNELAMFERQKQDIKVDFPYNVRNLMPELIDYPDVETAAAKQNKQPESGISINRNKGARNKNKAAVEEEKKTLIPIPNSDYVDGVRFIDGMRRIELSYDNQTDKKHRPETVGMFFNADGVVVAKFENVWYGTELNPGETCVRTTDINFNLPDAFLASRWVKGSYDNNPKYFMILDSIDDLRPIRERYVKEMEAVRSRLFSNGAAAPEVETAETVETDAAAPEEKSAPAKKIVILEDGKKVVKDKETGSAFVVKDPETKEKNIPVFEGKSLKKAPVAKHSGMQKVPSGAQRPSGKISPPPAPLPRPSGKLDK